MTPRTTLQLELEAIKAADQLNAGHVPVLNRKAFYNLFSHAIEDPHPERWISYYRQFVRWLPSISAGLDACCWDPVDLRRFLDIIRLFQDGCPEKEALTAEAARQVRVATALHFLHVGEVGLAADTLGWPPPPKESNQLVYEQLMNIAPPGRLRDELALAIKTACASAGLFRSETLNVLLVAGENDVSSGVVLPLHIRISERSADAEEDRVLFNNDVPLQHGGPVWSLQDAALAARRCLPNDLQNLYYSMQFSLSEKEAELIGSSMGLAAAILALCNMLNSFYGAPLYALNQNVALTGAIAPDGRLSAVNEQGLRSKISAAFFSPLERVFVAQHDLRLALQCVDDLNQRYPRRRLAVHGFDHLSQVMTDRNLVRQKKLTPTARLLSQTRRIYRKSKITFVASLVTLLFLVVVSLVTILHDRQPADFDIKGSMLIVKNKADEVLWSHDFGAPLTKAAYMGKDCILHPRVLFNDLNRDGRNEVLIGIDDNVPCPDISGHLFCFSAKGAVLWRGQPGRVIYMDHKEYENRYGVTEIQMARNKDGQRFVAMAASQYPHSPAFVALFDASGGLVGQYWNNGSISDMAVYDIDQDRTDEILASGYRDEDGRAFVAVLEMDNMWGLFPQDSCRSDVARDLPAGTERWYLRLPPSPFSNKDSYRDTASPLNCTKSYFAFNLSNCGVVDYKDNEWSCTIAAYLLDYRMNVIKCHTPDISLANIQRKLGRKLTVADTSGLSHIDYWDGEKWVGTATESKRYQNHLR